MKQQLVLFCLGTALLAALPAFGARADEMPLRKPGLWEMKIVKTGSVLPEMTMQHCTDETTDKQMSTAFSPVAKETCSKRDIAKTATGYVSDSVCGVGGVTMTSHADITGDFNSAYTVKSTAHSDKGPGGVARCHLDHRGEVARPLQARSEARRYRDARRLQDEHQGRRKAQKLAAEVALRFPLPACGEG